MSISSFCLQQRENEKAALKSLLAYSVAGSAALHLVLAFGIALIWPKEPSLAEDPIELIVIDSPEPEVIKPPEKAPKPLPTVKPEPLVTPPPEKPVATITPEAINTPPPPKIEEPPKPVEPKPLPQPIEKPLATIKPEPIPIPKLDNLSAPKVEELLKPVEPVEETKPETLPPPKVSQPQETNNSSIAEKPLQTPSVNSKPFQDPFTESKPTETANEEPPPIPDGLTANQQPPANNSTVTSQPLQPSPPENRSFRDNFTTANNSPIAENPSDDNSLNNPIAPGEIATNRETPPNKPIATSQPLQTSSNSNRQFRDSFSNSDNSLPESSLGDTSSSSIPEATAGVTANNQPPSRPVARSQPLQASSSTNRGFRDSFSNSNRGSFGANSNSDSDVSPGIPGMSEGVAANVGSPPKPSNSEQGGEGRGRQRRVRRGSAGGVRCISGCKPQYPSNLENVEGRPEVRFTLESDGSTTEPELAQTSGNSELDQAAIEAVRNMRFAPPVGGPVSIRIGINFAAGGSNFERQARERQEQNERLRRERERQQQQQEMESIEAENSPPN